MLTRSNPFLLTCKVDEISNAMRDERLDYYFTGASLRDINSTTIKIYNFSPSGDDLFVCKGDGFRSRIPVTRDLAVNLTDHAQQKIGTLLDRLKLSGGILVEVVGTFDPSADYAESGNIYEYVSLEPGKPEVSQFVPSDNHMYCIYISRESLNENPSGVFVPQVGMTFGYNRTLLVNKQMSMHGLPEGDRTGTLGLRFVVTAPKGYGGYYYSCLNGMPFEILPEEISEYADKFQVRVLLTKGKGEQNIATFEIPANDPKGEYEYKGQKRTFQLFRSEVLALEAEGKTIAKMENAVKQYERDTETLKQELTALKKQADIYKREADIVKREQQTSTFSKFVNSLRDIFAPVVKFAAVLWAFLA